MPVTTILQHQRERERLAQPDLDTPMPDHDQGPSMREKMQEVRLRWALAVEELVQVSLLTETEKAAAVAAGWIPPDSSYTVEILNRPFNPESSKASTPSASKGSSGVYNGSQTGGKKLGPPQGNPPDRQNTRNLPPTNDVCEMQQHCPQQYSSNTHDSGRISPDVYNATHRAVNALWAHRWGETASNDHNAWQAVSNSRVNEQTAPRAYNTLYTPPASQTQTSPLGYDGRQAPYADHHAGHPSPVERDAVQVYPNAPNATEAGSRFRENATASGPQASSATASSQPRQTSVWQHAYSQSTTGPRPASLQHSVTSSGSIMSLKSIVAPQSPAVVHPTMTAPSERILQPEVAPRPAAPSYPPTMPQDAVASQAMAAPQPPAVPQSVYTQPAYTQPTEAQPPHSWHYNTQTALSEPSHPQLYSQPACSEPGCTCSDPPRPYDPQPQSVYSQLMAESQQANVGHPEATPRPLATSQSTIASNSPATPWPAESSQATTAAQQPALPQHAMFSQPIPFRTMATSHGAGSPQQLATRPAAAGDSRISARKDSRESTKPPQAQDVRSLYGPEGSAIVEMTPSLGNKVVEFLLKYEPSMVAGSQVSNTLPKETAVHYNSVLGYQAQSLGLSFPHGRPEFHNGIDPKVAPHRVVPASQDAQSMQPTATHAGRTQTSQRVQGAGIPPRHGHFDVPAPQSNLPPHSFSRIPPAGIAHHNPTNRVGHSLNKSERGMAGAGSHGGDVQEVSQMDWQAASEGNRERRDDIQVVSRQDWRAANQDTSGRQFAYGSQHFAASAPQNTASQPSSSTPAKTQSAPQPCVTNIKGKMPLPKAQRPIHASIKAQAAPTKTPIALTRGQASRNAKSKYKAAPASGGVQKRKSHRVRQTTAPRPVAMQPAVPKTAVFQSAVPQIEAPQTPLPPAGREKQPTAYLSGSGLGLTQDDVDRWQEERQNPYRLPSFKDAFGHILMATSPTGYQHRSYKAEGGRFNLAAYRI
ncbi:hypothetical protein CCMA1212_004891 [Trichoderma ghanense]|uniref:Uncharacterized protein n=1 Tax=Trichoderma ghanense TaxID=65468 RepID=A0ABY2H6F3_9HYPO